MPEDVSIREQLRIFLKEKKAHIQQWIELCRTEIQDNRLTEQMDRMQVNLSVAQFGLFIRLFMEKGLIPKEDVGKTFAYYVRYLRNPKTSFGGKPAKEINRCGIFYSKENKRASDRYGQLVERALQHIQSRELIKDEFHSFLLVF